MAAGKKRRKNWLVKKTFISLKMRLISKLFLLQTINSFGLYLVIISARIFSFWQQQTLKYINYVSRTHAVSRPTNNQD